MCATVANVGYLTLYLRLSSPKRNHQSQTPGHPLHVLIKTSVFGFPVVRLLVYPSTAPPQSKSFGFNPRAATDARKGEGQIIYASNLDLFDNPRLPLLLHHRLLSRANSHAAPHLRALIHNCRHSIVKVVLWKTAPLKLFCVYTNQQHPIWPLRALLTLSSRTTTHFTSCVSPSIAMLQLILMFRWRHN